MMAGRSSQRLGDAAGLRQIGINLVRLEPGAMSSLRHWHRHEDEFVLVLDGICTLVTDAGACDMRRGDAAVFPAGRADGHQFCNRTDSVAAFLVAGTKAPHEVGTYSDADLMIHIEAGQVQFTRRDGTPLVARDSDAVVIPPRDSGRIPAALIRDGAEGWQDDNPAHPVLGPGPGPYRYRLLSDPGGLTQFGAFLEELPPKSSSGRRHWHEAEDEFVLILSGKAVLVEDTETTLVAGDAAAWPAGLPLGHRIDNRTDAPLRYLVIGTRAARDRIHYTDHDLITERDGTLRRYLHRDGTPYGDMP
jgi:uncharacterized cupin superfamily protein